MDRATLQLAEDNDGLDGYEVEVWAMRVGDVGLVGLPGEILTEIGLQIKQRSPLPYTMIASQANGYIGYIPTDQGVHEGGYEPGWSPVGRGQRADAGGDRAGTAERSDEPSVMSARRVPILICVGC